MKEKKVNLDVISLAIEIGMLKVYKDLQDEFDKWPEDPNGTLVTYEQLKMGLVKLEKYGLGLIEDIVGTLPDVEIPVEKPDPVVEKPEEEETEEYTDHEFHHTNTDTRDGGQSLVMCPGETEKFDRCECNGVAIPYHGLDKGRLAYWSMFSSGGSGYIICKKGDKKYRFKTIDKKIVKGSCW